MSNNGPDDADGATLHNELFDGVKNLDVECEVLSGSAVCPTDYDID